MLRIDDIHGFHRDFSFICCVTARPSSDGLFLSVFQIGVDISRDEVYNIMDKQLRENPETRLALDTRFAVTRADSKRRGKIEGITNENFTPENRARNGFP